MAGSELVGSEQACQSTPEHLEGLEGPYVQGAEEGQEGRPRGMWEVDEKAEMKTVLSHQTVATESIIRPGVESPAPLAGRCHLAAVLSVSPSNAQRPSPKI